MPASTYEKSVKGATKTKNAAPKSKYIEHILSATYSDAGIAEIFRTLQFRLRDTTWTIVFKSLIVIHMMIREGSSGSALDYLSQNPQHIAITSISDAQVQGGNICRYSEYLIARALAFSENHTDYVRNGQGKLKTLTVAKGLLRETEIVQKQIRALLKCDLLNDEPENEITLTAFRLLTLDLLTLYSVMNEGTINVLEHYFEMSRSDSERALRVYKMFSMQTEAVVRFLRVARQYENATRLEIPNLKHASTDLTKLLEDDLNDPDFSTRRNEYRSQMAGEKGNKDNASKSNSGIKAQQQSLTNKATSEAPPRLDTKAPAPDLIDFFGSIEQTPQPSNQQFMPQQQQSVQNPPTQQFQPTGIQTQPVGFPQQQTGFQHHASTGYSQPGMTTSPSTQAMNPFGQYGAQAQQQQPQQLQPNHTGAGFGGYTPQPQPQPQFQPQPQLQSQPQPQPQAYGAQTGLTSIPQDGIASFQQPMQTGSPRPNNPFRQSMLPPPDNNPPFNVADATETSAQSKRKSTNPFAKHDAANTNISPISSSQPNFQQPGALQNQTSSLQVQQPIQPQRTGTNPFARSASVPPPEQPAAATLQPTPTGSTNPFRQSALINQTTGQGWQQGAQQGTMGGMESLETVPIFPRPGQTA